MCSKQLFLTCLCEPITNFFLFRVVLMHQLILVLIFLFYRIFQNWHLILFQIIIQRVAKNIENGNKLSVLLEKNWAKKIKRIVCLFYLFFCWGLVEQNNILHQMVLWLETLLLEQSHVQKALQDPLYLCFVLEESTRG
jgi:hypothetical protein